MNDEQIIINKILVHSLISTQFPQWKNLPVTPVTPTGWDNRTFRLGTNMLVRMPSAKRYSSSVEIRTDMPS